MLVEEYIGKSESIREWNEDEFRMYEWKKVGLPKFGQVLGHNN